GPARRARPACGTRAGRPRPWTTTRAWNRWSVLPATRATATGSASLPHRELDPAQLRQPLEPPDERVAGHGGRTLGGLLGQQQVAVVRTHRDRGAAVLLAAELLADEGVDDSDHVDVPPEVRGLVEGARVGLAARGAQVGEVDARGELADHRDEVVL